MRKRIYIAAIWVLMFLGTFTGCSNISDDADSTNTSVDASGERTDGVCDLEIVRRNVVIDGREFEIPIKLSDINGDWSYELRDDAFTQNNMDEGYGIIYLKHNDRMLLECSIENYHKKLKDADIFLMTVFENDEAANAISIDDIQLGLTTKDEILKKYGEATSQKSFETHGYETWLYGTIAGDTPQKTDRYLSVMFDTESDNVISVTLSFPK